MRGIFKPILVGGALALVLATQLRAQTACSEVDDRDINSPDGRSVLAVHTAAEGTPTDGDLDIWLSTRGNQHHLKQVESLATVAALTDAVWAPDSQRFAVTVSDAGAVGMWHTYVYRLKGAKARGFTDVEPLLKARLRHFSHCDGGPEINDYAAAWLHHGRQLAVIAEVAPHSVCRDMGDERGFVVDVRTWRVVRVVPETKIPTSWCCQ